MAAAATDLGLPDLPITDAANNLMHADPLLGSLLIFAFAAIVALAIFIVRQGKDFRADLNRKDKRIVELEGAVFDAKNAQIGDLKESLTTVHDLRETMVAFMNTRGRRTT